jgi:hypothetical protein
MQIYISHSSDDKELARSLAAELERAGLAVWNEDHEILPGDNWAKKIGQALESSDVLIALVTTPGPIAEELARDVQYALTQGEHYNGRVVPVFVGAPAFGAEEIPWILRKLDPVKLTTPGDGFRSVIQRIQSLDTPVAHAAH